MQLHENLPDFQTVDPEGLQQTLSDLLDRNRESIDQLAQQETPRWETLGEPLEQMSNALDKVWSPASHLNSVANNESLRTAYNACLPMLSRYASEIGQHRPLQQAFQKLAVSEQFDKLDDARKKSIENTLRDFRLAGVDLPDDKKTRYREISSRLAELASQFSDNLLDATKAWTKHFETAADLKGLPDTALQMAAQSAEARGLEGYLLTLEAPSFIAAITYADNRALRQEIHEAYQTRASDRGPHAGQFDNSELMVEILRLRQEKAVLLGFGNYAELSLATKMADSPQEVLDFLGDLATKSLPFARRDFEELKGFARERDGIEIEAWDVAYYSEHLRQHKYSISNEALRAYFPADRVLSGLFDIVGTLFGIEMREDRQVQRYHPDVRFFRLIQDGEVIAAIYMDLFAREDKRSGAWMADYASRQRLDDDRVQMPVAFITCNFSGPAGNRPALLTHDEVTTLFHEFGHALHHMLTQIDCYDVAGINGVPWDAVELPSQFLENWCWQKEAIPRISQHWETGEPLPEEMLDRMLAARNFQAGMQMVRQLEFALFDFRLHCEFDSQGIDFIQSLLDQVRSEVSVIPATDYNRFQHGFAHIFAGGYAAGYYSYKWAEVLSADAFSCFEEEGIFNSETGKRYRDTILAQGGSREPIDLFVAFRGRRPDSSALLRHNGMS